MKQSTCLIFDPDTFSQRSIKLLVQSIYPNLFIITANTIQDFYQKENTTLNIKYAVCRLDQYLNSAIDILTNVKQISPQSRVLVISNNQSSTFMASLRRLGGIDVINPNQSYKSMQQKFHEFMHNESIQACDTTRSSVTHIKLTGRQQEVMQCIIQGFSNKRIAYEMGVSEGTIKLHVSSILRALKVTNRTEAAIKYQQLHRWPLNNFVYANSTNAINSNNKHIL